MNELVRIKSNLDVEGVDYTVFMYYNTMCKYRTYALEQKRVHGKDYPHRTSIITSYRTIKEFLRTKELPSEWEKMQATEASSRVDVWKREQGGKDSLQTNETEV